ncbi:hypothetical protein GZH82_13585 [Staphylococcus ursi]|uniref:hypothetical protein n=1 Tax=Staphylococcus sp. MI 10-1553 TaxID=1912064 RepID=UPI00139818E9|nr:hypothetical protein [Staphylococcus sp. MI 10-1553]QHW38273.1 hypothetical protein GZH82_13585 [Staphylococcus sp. MI 10-1553]
MLNIESIKNKYSNCNKKELRNNFNELIEIQWIEMKRIFNETEISQSLKFRFLYLYDQIKEMVVDKYLNIEVSFFILYNKRLERRYNVHEIEYQNCLDILNLFSDIENYLRNVKEVNLKQIHHLSKGVELMKKTNSKNREVVLC